ncbi:EVE domain-containing protein [Frigoribacterium sp. MCBA15_019]|uniref:EVE domain-containing protein n=1 Tax=Frigoribacterium sp. MCBA15_019 TaxID=1898745 RepID=UPI0009F1B028|nr:EVE domain-containing protein [Frigoribacterium sp. MCBA15_019]
MTSRIAAGNDPARGTQPAPRFWINAVTLDHVEQAVRGGFTQAEHGAAGKLRQPRRGDEMLFYSPRTTLVDRTPVRQFTAWATITADEPHQARVSDDFHPWRLAAMFHPWQPVDAKPLVDELSFVADPNHWGLPFRRGLFTIPEEDFLTITSHSSRG